MAKKPEKEIITEVNLCGSRYSLRRKRDGMGDSGAMWACYDLEASRQKNDFVWVDNSAGLVKVGYGIRCGTISAGMFSTQDWWQCGAVTEILEITRNQDDEVVEVQFKTENSTYTATNF